MRTTLRRLDTYPYSDRKPDPDTDSHPDTHVAAHASGDPATIAIAVAGTGDDGHDDQADRDPGALAVGVGWSGDAYRQGGTA